MARPRKIAMWASQTGHLVLSTLHTERRAVGGDAIDGHGRRAVHDLVDAPRRRGPAAGPQAVPALPKAGPSPPPACWLISDLDETDMATARIFGPGGCSHCHYTGYRGRVGIYEILVTTRACRSRIVQGIRDDDGLREVAFGEGMVGMPEDGLAKVDARDHLDRKSCSESSTGLRVAAHRSTWRHLSMTEVLPPQNESHELVRLDAWAKRPAT